MALHPCLRGFGYGAVVPGLTEFVAMVPGLTEFLLMELALGSKSLARWPISGSVPEQSGHSELFLG